ncbi:dihydroflavonol 4-reductase [Olea europaea subsp. europaea]|uniref:Dihydroflavonol 4-reductase n=1 Tax=Olea europaea subsp. europaea TaxID=158383 RepID=A0A8S0QEV6_OLEEU|nr:dihydroflavonol 4-reductase [Olea europaea subsp. europaea]
MAREELMNWFASHFAARLKCEPIRFDSQMRLIKPKSNLSHLTIVQITSILLYAVRAEGEEAAGQHSRSMTKYISTIFFSCFPEKAFHLLNQWESKDQFRLFRADLQEDGSFDEAVRGCDGVFHVAASMEFGVPASESANNIFCIVS